MSKPIVFGRGEKPINFVSVNDVAAVVERAVLATDERGQVMEIGGPRNLTFNQLAALLQQTRGRSEKVRHIPRPVLRAAAPFSRQVRATLAMDGVDMTFTPPRPAPRGPAGQTTPSRRSPAGTGSDCADRGLIGSIPVVSTG